MNEAEENMNSIGEDLPEDEESEDMNNYDTSIIDDERY